MSTMHGHSSTTNRKRQRDIGPVTMRKLAATGDVAVLNVPMDNAGSSTGMSSTKQAKQPVIAAPSIESDTRVGQEDDAEVIALRQDKRENEEYAQLLLDCFNRAFTERARATPVKKPDTTGPSPMTTDPRRTRQHQRGLPQQQDTAPLADDVEMVVRFSNRLHPHLIGFEMRTITAIRQECGGNVQFSFPPSGSGRCC
ncbi:uncharacterized protein LOC129582900 [Paramacrobiotus metropolitanus]|uniref:uncharacterized protein LOC129582900 n=1 Tax=Paramacrobiotus metropolitanus TaxID=2943436 RepID=UPI002445B2FB|nr:uncharacterized protein LOC129582900 [Paramacrobiotus metropolitanus]